MVQHRQQDCLEHHAFSERTNHGEYRTVRKEEFTFGVTGDVPTEAVVAQPVGHQFVLNNPTRHQMVNRVVIEPETLNGIH